MTAPITYRLDDSSVNGFAPVLDQLRERFDLEEGEEQSLRRVFLDSFDWRLARAGYVLEASESGTGHRLEWKNRDTDTTRLTIEVPQLPRFASDLGHGPLRERLARLLDVRALVCEAYVESRIRHMALRNRHEKIVARIEYGHYLADDGTGKSQQDLGRWLFLKPVRGYAGPLERAREAIESVAKVAVAGEDLLSAAVRALGHRSMDYSSKPDIRLEPAMPAWQALQHIFNALLENIRANESGMCADRDPEFLHDFRVAVRRTRSAISDVRGVIPKGITAPFREEFRWLQEITGPARDLDVYLMGFAGYQADLSPQAADDLLPFRDFLVRTRQEAHLNLTRGIRSDRYVKLVREWPGFVATLDTGEPGKHHAEPIGTLATDLIDRAHRTVVRDGRAIGEASPATDLHELRKRCKRLRYLLEFFSSLHPPELVQELVRALKGLQDNLGNFQDYEVQSQSLDRFSRRMMEQNAAPPETYLAMGQLIEQLEEKQKAARSEFHDRFAAFDSAQTRKVFARMVGSKRRRKAGAES